MFNHREKLKEPCPKCGFHDWRVGTAITASGSTVHPYYCSGCGTRTQLYERKETARRMGCSVKISIPIREIRKCEVCGAEGAEVHHWAPRSIFGDEAERWPTSLLCVPCHSKWHSLLTLPIIRQTIKQQPPLRKTHK